MRSAVERQLLIVGEAISQLAKLDPGLTESIPEYQRIIAFRNILAHGYSAVDDATVWDVVDTKLQPLKDSIADLLKE